MSRLPGLDLLRAIAVIWVMLFHSFLVGGLGPDFAWLSRYGWDGRGHRAWRSTSTWSSRRWRGV